MPAFKPAGSYSQSQDGKTITFTDGSNYADNTDGVTLNNVKSRTLHVLDGAGNVIGNPVITPGQTTVNFTIIKDMVLDTQLDWVKANNAHVTADLNYLADSFYWLGFMAAMAKVNCACSKGSNLCNSITKGVLTQIWARRHFSLGQLSKANEEIQAANVYVKQSNCKCL